MKIKTEEQEKTKTLSVVLPKKKNHKLSTKT